MPPKTREVCMKDLRKGVKAPVEELDLFGDVDKVRWENQENFFGNLHLSPSGGLFGEMESLWSPNRYMGASVFFVVLGMNIYNLWHSDLDSLKEEGGVTTRMPLFAFAPCNVAHLLAYFELAGLFYYLVITTYLIVSIACPHLVTRKRASLSPASEAVALHYTRWRATAELFKRVLPLLQSFSAMRVLQYVTPSVLTPNLQLLLQTAKKNKYGGKKTFTAVLGFLLTHIFLLTFGFAAFLVKFSEAAEYLYESEHRFKAVIKILLFMNQMLGVVQISVFVNSRLFQFIFGGVDNFMDKPEISRMHVWEAMLQKRMWESATGRPVRYVALSVTFGDADFQRLVLDDANDEHA